MNTYRIYGRDDDDYAFGGPLFGPLLLKEVKANTPGEAIRKYYDLSKRKRLGWRLSDLSAKRKGEKK